ncbi:MAG: hypothetical protein ACRDY7_13415, partial [Acidimicrobiia bacterium]
MLVPVDDVVLGGEVGLVDELVLVDEALLVEVVLPGGAVLLVDGPVVDVAPAGALVPVDVVVV